MALDLRSGRDERAVGSQILVWCGEPSERVAGLELWRRAVYTACRAGFERIVIVAESLAEQIRRDLADDYHVAGSRWEVLRPADGWLESVRAAGGRWVVLPDRWIVDAAHLTELAAARGEPTASSAEGPFSADSEDLSALVATGWSPLRSRTRAFRRIAAPPLYARVTFDHGVRAAEDALFESLARNVTNPFARYVDRAMSGAISRWLSPYPVTPNQITLFSMGLGIVGALLLLRPTYGSGLAGSFLFLASTIIDGCDGEIARLKFQESARGAKLDLVADNVVHAVLFPCVALRAHFGDPSGPYLLLGAIALGGVIVTWLAVYWVIVRGEPSARAQALFELFGNREFAYLFFFLGLIGALHWFVWGMAIGLWVFPLALVGLRFTER
jgi:1L-myo-inositol 1-phosphate cytidylyltransferase / CDP-L-myo-inositol myo-inositolphosphotransferase